MNPLHEIIRRHIIEEGDCWVWTGALQPCGSVPTMKYQGKTGSVRRFIMLDQGFRLCKRWATYSCGNPMCVNPEHTICAERKTVQLRTAAEQKHQSHPVRIKRLTDSLRKHAKLTAELAMWVRESDTPNVEIAWCLGVNKTTIGAIKRNKIWKDYTPNPFAGLGA